MFGLGAGLLHPAAGIDHVLAMVAVGILATQTAGISLWVLPIVFVSTMAATSFLGFLVGGTPLMEIGVTGPVLILGAVIAQGRALPTAMAVGLVGAFAIFHGHTHGTEIPAYVGGIGYGAGFMLTTVFLHAVGVVLGVSTRGRGERFHSLATRAYGGAIAVAGIALIAT